MDINDKCILDILKFYFKRLIIYGAETSKTEESKIPVMEIKL